MPACRSLARRRHRHHPPPQPTPQPTHLCSGPIGAQGPVSICPAVVHPGVARVQRLCPPAVCQSIQEAPAGVQRRRAIAQQHRPQAGVLPCCPCIQACAVVLYRLLETLCLEGGIAGSLGSLGRPAPLLPCRALLCGGIGLAQPLELDLQGGAGGMR